MLGPPYPQSYVDAASEAVNRLAVLLKSEGVIVKTITEQPTITQIHLVIIYQKMMFFTMLQGQKRGRLTLLLKQF